MIGSSTQGRYILHYNSQLKQKATHCCPHLYVGMDIDPALLRFVIHKLS